MRVKKIKTNGLLYNFIVIDLPLNWGIIRLFNAVNARPLSCRLGKCQMSGPALEGLRPSQRLALANAALFTATVSTAAALLLVGFVRGCKLGPFCSLSGTRRLHGSDRVADDRGRDQKAISPSSFIRCLNSRNRVKGFCSQLSSDGRHTVGRDEKDQASARAPSRGFHMPSWRPHRRFVVHRERARERHPRAGGEHADRVRVFGPRMLVGEIAFMLRVPRTASLRVEEDAIVWSLGRHAFEKLTGSGATLVLALLQDVLRLQSERLAFATRHRGAETLNIVAHHGARIPSNGIQTPIYQANAYFLGNPKALGREASRGPTLRPSLSGAPTPFGMSFEKSLPSDPRKGPRRRVP